jgi:hypothetical protein
MTVLAGDVRQRRLVRLIEVKNEDIIDQRLLNMISGDDAWRRRVLRECCRATRRRRRKITWLSVVYDGAAWSAGGGFRMALLGALGAMTLLPSKSCNNDQRWRRLRITWRIQRYR